MAELEARLAGTAPSRSAAVARMLGAHTIAVVGASDRPGSFGLRLATEALRSPGVDRVHLVHPTRAQVLGRRCVPSLADVPEPVDLVLLGVPDTALVEQVALAAARGDGGAVVFGGAVGVADELRTAADGLPLCGPACMGFVNVARGVRAIGYLEPDPLPAGGISLITHSGSVFSALLRTHRRLEFAVAVSSGQELVTTTADYLGYALDLPETRAIGLFLETLRDPAAFRSCLARAADRDIPVVALTVGGSATGRALVSAHSGALAGEDAGWEALFAAYGVHRATDLAELVDSLELFSIGRRLRPASRGQGIATVHDSGGERTLVADLAAEVEVPFAPLADDTRDRLTELLGPGLRPENPLDVWSTGADTAHLFADCMAALAEDESVGVVALSVDLVAEYDGDQAYLEAVEAVLAATEKPVAVLANLPAAVDRPAADRLRAQGVPVLEGTRSALRALGHLVAAAPPPRPRVDIDRARRRRWLDRLAGVPLDQASSMELLRDYGIDTVPTLEATTVDEAVGASKRLGYPLVLKTDRPDIPHKLAVGGVHLGLADASEVRAAYLAVADSIGPAVVLQHQLAPAAELYLGILHDPLVGPLVVAGVGGTLVEMVAERRVALPPIDLPAAVRLLGSLTGLRSRVSAEDLAAGAAALVAISRLAVELEDRVAALDVNPLLLATGRAVAVDVFLQQA